MNGGARGRGGNWVGEGWVEVERGQVEESRGSGETPPDRLPHPSSAGKFALFGTALGGVGESHWPVCLCPRGSVSPRLAGFRPSKLCPLQGLDLGASLQPSGPRIGQIAPPRGQGSSPFGVSLETRQV